MKEILPEPFLHDSARNMKRRDFLRKSAVIGTMAGISGISLAAGCKRESSEVTPVEDLMREHGVLNRIMLIYDNCRQRLLDGQAIPGDALLKSALIISNFIENYHEKLEEEHIFPRFLKAAKMADLVQTLWIQHTAGRKITEQLIRFGRMKSPPDADTAQKAAMILGDFNRMYRPHESREDTVLFPALRGIVSASEYEAMGENFEKKEHELFGEGGFGSVVMQVEEIEKQLGIFDLASFIPTQEGLSR